MDNNGRQTMAAHRNREVKRFEVKRLAAAENGFSNNGRQTMEVKRPAAAENGFSNLVLQFHISNGQQWTTDDGCAPKLQNQAAWSL
jgi:hypothetical protein